jgi:RNA polymerase sigma-70 factor (ECF subfamily)
MLEDRILILRFNRGDAAALRRIYHKYRNDLLKVALALLHDRSAVEDVVHDVFVSFAQESGRFELRGSLKGYLSICVANRARDRNRSRRRTGVSLHEADLVHSQAAMPAEAATRADLFFRVREAMDLLPDEQREVIVLRVQSRLRFREIAERKGVSVNTIQSRYRYGLDRLRSLLDGQVKR